MDIEHLDSGAACDRLDEIERVYAEAFPDHDLSDYRARMQSLLASPGFEAVTARDDGALAGFVYGASLSARSSWWDDLEPVQPAGFTAETGRRTFAVIDLAVRPAHRGRGPGHRLLDELLAGQPEERAALATTPDEGRSRRCTSRGGGAMSAACQVTQVRPNPGSTSM
ncbi:GNAT family N-acetyltransferase [Actinomadura rubrisoli]|uniref:GNAT family N-acetyltransferase n=1 Tax=Actinomadura rubrisoli TaxID=2530368 RepID=A0A4R5C908_9ACTN|nr:GNAT family N-acetyltransferase [Actinomadura rubrisoli]TDD93492.1 GNAT family N-acetyltransferase [Actinomadura rubrisoli]